MAQYMNPNAMYANPNAMGGRPRNGPVGMPMGYGQQQVNPNMLAALMAMRRQAPQQMAMRIPIQPNAMGALGVNPLMASPLPMQQPMMGGGMGGGMGSQYMQPQPFLPPQMPNALSPIAQQQMVGGLGALGRRRNRRARGGLQPGAGYAPMGGGGGDWGQATGAPPMMANAFQGAY